MRNMDDPWLTIPEAGKRRRTPRTFRDGRCLFIVLRPGCGRESTSSHFYASLVEALCSHSSRGPGRRRSGQPQVPAPRRLHPPARRRHLQLPLPRPALAEQDHRHRARGDGQDRPGVLSPRHPAQGAVGRERPLDRHGRQHVPPQGPQGRRPLPGHDPRRDHDHHRPQRTAQLQAAAADLVPDPDQVPRRAAAQGRACCACASSS